MALLAIGAIKSESLTKLAESELFQDKIIYAKSSSYQRIVVTRGRTGFGLFLNGNLQFNSFDEYRYHEALVHPAMISFEGDPKRILVLGGGDGLAVREVLKYKSVEKVTLVDLDPAITKLALDLPLLADLNNNALKDERVEIINADAFVWLDDNKLEPFDVAIVDFPDPNNFALGKLYSTRFYKLLKAKLKPNSSLAIQSTSPLYARNSFWCIAKTLESVGFSVNPYQTTVPSFGIWGYVLAKQTDFKKPTEIPKDLQLKFLDSASMSSMFDFPVDASKPEDELEVNTP